MTTRRRRADAAPPAAQKAEEGSADPVVVGIGASAGGLEAFSRLLHDLSPTSGMAFVLVQHLDPDHPSLLTHLLTGKTPMPVSEASDGARVAPNHVLVAPPGEDIAIEQGTLRLRKRDREVQPHLPIDGFLRSLAEDKGERAIGVVLSGAASDGTQGLAAIKSAGGLTFAQEPSSADYPSMPLSAIGARVVDFVLPPEEIARELARLGTQSPFAADMSRLREDDAQAGAEAEALDELFGLLKGAFRVDFSAYKLPTVRRRVSRRMLVRQSADLEEYVGLLRDDPSELEALYRDMLIVVTEFFREPETFTVLRDKVVPAILSERREHEDVRIWVPGCASGEEAYSLAITLLEVMKEQRLELPVRVFATDISEPDLATARRGVYPAGVSATVAPELLRRYFVRSANGYQVSKAVRELCVFARHDVTSDPPFPNLDLVSCRNLLIYLSPGLQRWVIPSLHYGLRPDGYLVLGRSESIGGFDELFEAVDKKHKIFRKLAAASPTGYFRFRAFQHDQPDGDADHRPPERGARARGQLATRAADELVLACFAPPGVTVDAQRNVLEFRGDPAPYLKIRAGRASLNLLDLVREELRAKVRAVLTEAERTGKGAAFRRVSVGKGKAKRMIDLHAMPFRSEAGDPLFVVLFEEVGGGAEAGRHPDQAVEPSEAEQLREELGETRERLEAVIQSQEAANEELRATNEELMASSEETQSMNEELETTQEELQSTNQELRARNLELGRVSDDLSNLLTSVSFPIIMVGNDLRIRHFTPAAARLFAVIPSDVGRLITDLRLRIDLPDLEQILAEVIETTVLIEREVQDDEGRWYAMQVRPYKTLDNRIDGAVITLFDIDEMKRLLAARKSAEAALQESETRLTIATDAAALGVHDYDIAAGTVGWDARVREIWGIGSDQVVTYDTFLNGVLPSDRATTQAAIDRAMASAGNGQYHAVFRVRNAIDGSLRWVSANGQVLFADAKPVRLVGTVEDITDRRRIQEELLATELAAAEQEERVRLARELHDTATQALFAATLKAEALTQSGEPLPAHAAEEANQILRLSRGALAEMRTLLLELRAAPLEQVSLARLLQQLVEALEGRVGISGQMTVREEVALPPELHVTVYRVAQEALNNVARHANAAHAWVLLETAQGHAHLRVEDDGQGFDPDTVDPSHLGLRSMRERAEEVGAEFSVGKRSGGGTVVSLEWDEKPEAGP